MQETPTQKPRLTLKATNPKDGIGIRKPRCFHVLSGHVERAVSIAMMEGAMKYGSHNYRVAGVRASVYYDATKEHLESWWEGETIDPDSGLPHVIKAIASLYVLADAIIQGKCEDDRPPNFVNLQEYKADLQRVVNGLFEKYPNPEKGYTQLEVNQQLGRDGSLPETAYDKVTRYLAKKSIAVPELSSVDKIAAGLKDIPKAPDDEPRPEGFRYDGEAHNLDNHTPPKVPSDAAPDYSELNRVRARTAASIMFPNAADSVKREEAYQVFLATVEKPLVVKDKESTPPRGMGLVMGKSLLREPVKLGNRNPDADMTAGELQNLDKLSQESMEWLKDNEILPKD